MIETRFQCNSLLPRGGNCNRIQGHKGKCRIVRRCEHDVQREYCKKCGGSQICEHATFRSICKKCGGARICEHCVDRSVCKKCGTSRMLLQGGFSPEQIRDISRVLCCQFPGCFIQGPLVSDHHHGRDSHRRITIKNYRGEVCVGHNRILADLDKHPEWATPEQIAYMQNRPFLMGDLSHD